MKKGIVVSQCRDCFFIRNMAALGIYCYLEMNTMETSSHQIKQVGTIPKWCPLPDYKEKKR